MCSGKEVKSKKTPTGTKYQNQILVFSGFRDNDFKEDVESQGGKVSDTINSKTTILVVKDKSKTTGKIKKSADS